MLIPLATATVIMAFIAFSCSPASAAVFYENDFEVGDIGDGPGPEWSSNTRINRTPSHRRFLGASVDERFGLSNDDAVLTLNALPRHTEVTLSFSVLVIQAWTGARADADGQNIFQIHIDGNRTHPLLKTTFSNTSDFQHYPGAYGGDLSPPFTGASEVNTLGYGNIWNGDSVYDLTLSFDHSGSSLTVDFGVTGLVGYGKLNQQSWGLDNVIVYLAPVAPPVPEPSTFALFGLALAALSLGYRRTQSPREFHDAFP